MLKLNTEKIRNFHIRSSPWFPVSANESALFRATQLLISEYKARSRKVKFRAQI